MSAEQTSPTTEERIAFKRAELHRGHWCDDCATLARQQALTDAIAAVEGLPMTFGVHTCWDDHMGEGGAHEDGSECHDRILGESVGRAAVIDTLTRLREGS